MKIQWNESKRNFENGKKSKEYRKRNKRHLIILLMAIKYINTA